MYIKHEIYKGDVESAANENLDWNKLAGKSLLLTGATGLIGTMIVDVLMKKNREENLNLTIYAAGRNEKIAAQRFADYWDDKNFQFVKMNVNEPITQNFSVNYIIHAASNSQNKLFSSDPVNTIMANILGAYNLLEYGVKSQLERFLFVSSGDSYGQTLNDADVFDEKYCGYIDCNTLRADYPESKRASESLCQAYISQHNMDIVIARPCRIYGATMRLDDSKAMSEFIMNGVRSENIVLKSEGLPKFSYCYVADCVTGIFYTLLKGKCGEAYNIADSSEILTLREIAEYISEISGTKVIFELPDKIQARGFSKSVRAILTNDKLRGLGWTSKDDTRSGVKKTIEIVKTLV